MTGSISTVGEKDNYTFTATAGDTATIRVAVTSGSMNPSLELYDSTGTKVASNYSSSGNYTSIDKSLTTGGTYTIVVYDYGNDETGDYNLTYLNLRTACNATALTSGQTISRSLDVIGEVDFYKFTATAGDGATIKVVRTSGTMNPYIELYDSTGTKVASNYSSSGNYASIDKSLTTGGTYTIVVYDYDYNGIGNYNITYMNLTTASNATAIPCGQTTSGSISAAGEIDFYYFTATAGDTATIRVAVTSGSMNPSLELYDSTGTKVASNYSSSGNYTSTDKSLTTGGTYTIVVYDYGNDATGNYTLKYQKNNNYCPEAIVNVPNGGEIIESGTVNKITWSSTASQGIVSQDIKLSTDGGLTFPVVIATGLAGTVQSFDWNIPTSLYIAKARIRVTVTDTIGQVASDDSDADFLILQSVPKVTHTYEYDKLNHLTKITFEDGTTVTYTYDALGNRTALTGSGTGTGYTLTVNKTGTGSGTVTSNQAGIDCGTDCTEIYNQGTVVTLTATPDTGSTFAGWSGGCSGSGACQVTMNTDTTVTATFTLTVSECSEWDDVIGKYEAYVRGEVAWSSVIACYQTYISTGE
ncbi:MAG: RHS repeat protein [Proteobacteria bacterium]|nr:RHS repeat protein [Pseudomonadota bacterium]